MGTLAGKLAPMAGSDDKITWLSDPLDLPQVNGTVESLGERRGYAPFSPDENSLVLFDGRAVAALGCGRVVSSKSGGPGLGKGLQVLSALTHAPFTTPRGRGILCNPETRV